MAIAEFPLPSVSGSNPPPLITYELPERFQVDSVQYDDGGRDVKLQNGGNGIKSWVLAYDGLTEAQVAILDAHMLAAKLPDDGPSGNSFNFRDPKTTTLYTTVRYLSYERVAHKKRWSNARNITLVKYP